MDLKNIKKIAFQGAKGAYSDLACRTVFPTLKTVPCDSFEDTFTAVTGGKADLAMIPIDNTIAGRVADVHHLMPNGNLYIIGEHFQPIRHALLGIKGSKIEDLKHVHSHVHAIPQCRKIIRRLNLKAHIHADTAGAAEDISNRNDPRHGAIASDLAAEIYNLEILEHHIQDEHHNTTRFLILGPQPEIPDEDVPTITSLIFGVRNIPAALYKCLGGFATNNLSLSKLESYVDPNFQAARFFCDIEGHPDKNSFKLALEELGFYATDVKFLGAYPAHPFRANNNKGTSIN
ncbi:MAG TPA: prephenate dehydratase [Alphaproteobacteria bacterium]|nr:prephenate dehydratase [Alphaproteobacteria bacterium]USO05334.1 MAG: prephenate dehydratase [Rhodospirillales bacterium]HOO81397.1 prephenate dehydratase [Alphaproteobacteria bacterium]